MAKTTVAPKFVLLDNAGTTKLIAQIKTAGTKLDVQIDYALRCSAIHAHTHSDASLIEQLLLAIPKGIRSNAVKEWLVQFAPMALNPESQKLVFSRPYDNKDEEARSKAIKACEEATVWTALKPEPKFVPFVMQDALASLLSKAEKALKDTEKNDVTEEQVAKLKAMVQALA